MVTAGVTFVQTELLSQAIFQIVYQILNPIGWDAFSAINLVSCIAGALSIWVLIRFNTDYAGVNPLWVLGLLASSGLILFCTGHTEYYTLFLITQFYYGYAGIGYLRGRLSSLHVSLAFSLAAWMHLGIMFAFPTLLLLPALRRQWKDYSGIFCGLTLTVAAFLLKDFSQIFGINVQGLSPSKNFIPLWEDLNGERFYLMFQWGHLADYLYAWAVRSWIYWPALFWAALLFGWRSFLHPERLFLLLYTLGFTFFTLTWHPNLGIHQDWDLFALEAAPCLLLLITYLPNLLQSSFRRILLAIPILASTTILYQQIMVEARFGQRGYGSVRIEISEKIPCQVNLNGHLKRLNNPAIREGIYEGRLRNIRYMRSHLFYLHVSPHKETHCSLLVGPDYGKSGPDRYTDEEYNQWRRSLEEGFEQ